MFSVQSGSAQAFTEYMMHSLFVKYLVLPQNGLAMSKSNLSGA